MRCKIERRIFVDDREVTDAEVYAEYLSYKAAGGNKDFLLWKADKIVWDSRWQERHVFV